jgi:hypothetical protein
MQKYKDLNVLINFFMAEYSDFVKIKLFCNSIEDESKKEKIEDIIDIKDECSKSEKNCVEKKNKKSCCDDSECSDDDECCAEETFLDLISFKAAAFSTVRMFSIFQSTVETLFYNKKHLNIAQEYDDIEGVLVWLKKEGMIKDDDEIDYLVAVAVFNQESFIYNSSTELNFYSDCKSREAMVSYDFFYLCVDTMFKIMERIKKSV